MTRPPTPRRPRHRGVPSWLLAVLVVLALGGSALLFLRDGSSDDRERRPATARDRDDDGVLKLPGDDAEATRDERRRGDTGRGRLDDEEASQDAGDEDPDGTTEAEDEADAPAPDALRGMRIALVAVDAGPPAGTRATKAARVGGVRTTCALATAVASRRASEDLVLDALASSLRAAGATVTRLDNTRGTAPCVAARVAQLERADVGIVVRARPAGVPGRLTPAIAAAGLPAAERSRAATLARELAAGSSTPLTPTAVGAVRTELAAAGVIDLPGGGSTIELALAADRAASARDARQLAARLTRTIGQRAEDEPAEPDDPAPAPTG